MAAGGGSVPGRKDAPSLPDCLDSIGVSRSACREKKGSMEVGRAGMTGCQSRRARFHLVKESPCQCISPWQESTPTPKASSYV